MAKILIVDDEHMEKMKPKFEDKGHEVIGFDNKKEAINIIQKTVPFDVAIIDMNLGDLDKEGGLEIANEVRERSSLTEIIIITAYADYKNIYKTMEVRLWGYIDRNLDHNLNLEVDKALKYVEVQKGVFESLKVAIDSNDPYTHGHSKRVAEYTELIAIEWNKINKTNGKKVKVEDVKMAAGMHDIGKIGINTFVLNKPTKLTNAEMAMIRIHPVEAERILKEIPGFREAEWIEPIRQHHEKWDAEGGYPDAIKKDKIHINARIIAIADSFDAITSDRPYSRNKIDNAKKEGKDLIDFTIDEIKSCSGRQYDPNAVNAFLNIPKEDLRKIMEEKDR